MVSAKLGRVDFQVAAMDRCLGQPFGQLRGFNVVLRQLVGAVQDVAEAELGVGRKHMGLQMYSHRVHLCHRDAARRNLKPGPGQQRHGDHHDVEAVVGVGAACFGTGLDHVGQFVIGARASGIELVEHGDQGLFGVVGQQAIYVAPGGPPNRHLRSGSMTG
jgi:hypothetical protein